MFAAPQPQQLAVKHKDVTGIDIKVGDYVVYFVQQSRRADLRIGKVLELKTRKGGYYQYDPITQKHTTSDTPTLKVVCTSLNSTPGQPQKWVKGHTSTLQRTDNFFVVDASQLSQDIINSLK